MYFGFGLTGIRLRLAREARTISQAYYNTYIFKFKVFLLFFRKYCDIIKVVINMKFGIICVSDRCFNGEKEDMSGPAIAECVRELSTENEYRLVPDEKEMIENAITELADKSGADVVFTTGGTGFAPRDITPEATKAVIEKEVPGISEAIRAKSLEITDRAMLSRAVSGIRGKTLIINLPGSPKAVRESIEVVLPVLEHAVETISGNTQNCGGNYGK